MLTSYTPDILKERRELTLAAASASFSLLLLAKQSNVQTLYVCFRKDFWPKVVSRRRRRDLVHLHL